TGGTGTGTGGDEEEISEGMGGIGYPPHKSSFLLGSTVNINIQPAGQISLGGISISGTLNINMNGSTVYTEKISTTDTSGYYNTSYKPDKVGTYWIDVSLGYYLSGASIQTSRYKLCFYVTAPECATHTYGKWTVTRKATYTTTGIKQRTCTVCGHVESAPVSKLKITSGAVLESKAARYVVQKDLKTVHYKAPLSKAVKNVSIPATIKLAGKTYKITGISAKAFYGCADLAQLAVGKNVKRIGASACSGCGSLKKIVIKSEALSSVGANALSGIAANAVLEVPSAKVAEYKKLFAGKGQAAGVKIRAAS
ncbi:MAG: leucine-rich repeat protein, partial [Lachnospiraceae bacterium]|nr:leucine-rich repeat protein [Lachnospiraceae bacterium]